MKKLGVLIVSVFLVSNLNAQDFVKGGNYVTIGFGLDPWGYPKHVGGYGFGNYTKSAIGPIAVRYERGITDVLGIGRIGVGGGIAQTFYSEKWVSGTYTSAYNRSRLTITARAAYHFEFDVPKMDVYAGVGVGVHIYTDTRKEEYEGNLLDPLYNYKVKSNSVGGGEYFFAGIRYYFSDHFGVYAEAGYGLSALNGGVVFSF